VGGESREPVKIQVEATRFYYVFRNLNKRKVGREASFKEQAII
jgi:hypothetical protein